MSDAAREVGIGLIGGAIIRDPKPRRCYNTALAFDRSGELGGSYRKLHLPEEEGFWETSHYDPGDQRLFADSPCGSAFRFVLMSTVQKALSCWVLLALK
jgi:predicted amidohydrolase